MYIRLSETGQFRIIRFVRQEWKKINTKEHRVFRSPEFIEGYRLMFTWETDQGFLDLSLVNTGVIYAQAILSDGSANPCGLTFNVEKRSVNNKIIYHFKRMEEETKPEVEAQEPPQEEPVEGEEEAAKE